MLASRIVILTATQIVMFISLLVFTAGQSVQSNYTEHETGNTSSSGSALLPFGNGTGDLFGPFGLDSSSPPLNLSEPFKFFGREYKQIIVNSNGVLSLGEAGFTEYMQRPFPFYSPPLIAPYWFDFDARQTGNISYRVSNDSELLNKFHSLLEDLVNTNLTNFTATQLFIATWNRVPVFLQSFSSANIFQVVLATDTLKTVSVFIYDTIEQGPEAQVGFNAGDGYTYYMLSEALSDQTLDLDHLTNAGKDGVFIYRVDNLKLVQCSTTLECTNTDLDVMTARDCCIGSTSGLSYKIPDSEECCTCVVVGWFNDSYTGVEQRSSYKLQVGYQKGAEVVGQDFQFIVELRYNFPEQAQNDVDFTIINTNGVVSAGSDSEQQTYVEVTFLEDNIALEGNETATLQLNSIGTVTALSGEGVYFRREIKILIMDSDVLDIYLSQESYEGTESSQGVAVQLCKSKTQRISWNIYWGYNYYYYGSLRVYVSAETVENAIIKGIASPESFPADNPNSPNRADSKDFYTGSVREVLFDADEMFPVADAIGCFSVTIPIIDDNINEADQVFIIHLNLAQENLGAITLSRNKSLIWINDDDSIAFGFEQPSYSFIEPPFEEIQQIFITTEDSRLSEQTFIVVIETISLSLNCNCDHQPATIDQDFHAEPMTVKRFKPHNVTQHRLPYEFTLFTDNVTEEIEEFVVSLNASLLDDEFPSYLLPSTLSLRASIIIIDSQNLIGFSQKNLTVNENEEVVKITIYSFTSVDNLTISFTTFDGTATEGYDYEGAFQQSVLIEENSESSVIEVTIVDDEIAEGAETFVGMLVVKDFNQSFSSEITIEILDNEVKSTCGNMYKGRNCSKDSLCTVSGDGRSIIGCDCVNGYHGSGFVCIDTDECANGQNNCSLNANCTNTNGSYECHCKDSYIGDGLVCNDAVNEVPGPCSNSRDNCTCYNNTMSGLRCACRPGFEVMKKSDETTVCKRITDCRYMICNGICINNTCYCSIGYTFNSAMKTCVDLDECLLEQDDCDTNANCINTNGSYTCSCKDGYYGNGEICFSTRDCNEETGTSNCGCSIGYYFDPSTGQCEDVNECNLPSTCNTNATCLNDDDGSFSCVCKEGFLGNGQICNDVDECDDDTDDCDENADCSNNEGSFSCTCKHLFYGDGKTCASGIRPLIEPAPTTPVRPNYQLSYTIGENFCLEDSQSFPNGATVKCPLANDPVPSPPSYTVTAVKIKIDGRREELDIDTTLIPIVLDQNSLSHLFDNDTDVIMVTCQVANSFGSDNKTTLIRHCNVTECQDGVTNNCSQVCERNGSGRHECGCYSDGYELIMGNCSDINECHSNISTHNCSEVDNQVCRNTMGSFECDCVPGFQKQDGECEDIPECDKVPSPCPDHENEYCNELLGNYTCECKNGFLRSTQNSMCIDINECNLPFNNCMESNKDCFNVIGSYLCQCKEGFKEISNNCTDVDECKSGPLGKGNCSHECQNTVGSYSCYCPTGYVLNVTDNSTCHDIDECQLDMDNCHTNAECINTNGSFNCRCKPLYRGDGITNCIPWVTIASVLGSISFILVVSILLVLFCLCYYIRRSKLKEADDIFFSDDDSQSRMRERRLSVQSSFKLNLPPKLIVSSSTINIIKTVGQGEFGIVYKGTILRNHKGIVSNTTVAIKTLKGFYDSSAVREMLKESSKMYKFDHPNVLTLIGVCLDGGPAPFIIMPFMANGSLLAYLRENRASLVVTCNDNDTGEVEFIQKQLLGMCIQVARGMEYLAKMKVVHRDLAARNCMIDMNFVIKVADFGLSESTGTKDYFRQDKSAIIKLPLKWLAPESIEDYVFSEKSDVWAYGVTCWEIFSGGKVPYSTEDITELPNLLANGRRLKKPKNKACNDEMYTNMTRCWEFEAERRPSFSEMVESLSVHLETLAKYVDIGSSQLVSDSLERLDIGAKSSASLERIDSHLSKDSSEEELNLIEIKASSTENLIEETSF